MALARILAMRAFVFLEDPMGEFVLQVKVSRELFFRFKRLCQAHGVTLGRGVEELHRRALERAGVEALDTEGKERSE